MPTLFERIVENVSAGFMRFKNFFIALGHLVGRTFAQNNSNNKSNGHNVASSEVPITKQNTPATPVVNSGQSTQILNDNLTLNASGDTATQVSISEDKTGALDHTPNDDEDEFFDALGEPHIAESVDESEVESKAKEFFDARSELSPDEENGVDGDASPRFAEATYRQDDDSAVLQIDKQPTEVTEGQNIGFAVDPVNVGNFGLNQGAHGPSTPEVSESQTENTGNVATFENDKYYSTQLSTDGKFEVVESLNNSVRKPLTFALYNVNVEVKKSENSDGHAPYKVAGFKMDANASENKSYTLRLQNGGSSVEVYGDHARLGLPDFFEFKPDKKKPACRKDMSINKIFEYTCKPGRTEDGQGEITPEVILLMDSNKLNFNPKLGVFLSPAWGIIKRSSAAVTHRINRPLFPMFNATFALEAIEEQRERFNITIVPDNLKTALQKIDTFVARTLICIPYLSTIVGSIVKKITKDQETASLPIEGVLIKGHILNDIQHQRAELNQGTSLDVDNATSAAVSSGITGNQEVIPSNPMQEVTCDRVRSSSIGRLMQ